MSAELLSLAERCQAAEGPGAEERQLVIDAFHLVFPPEIMLNEDEKGDDETRYQRTLHQARFTRYINTDYERASLDAAMMLLPKGCGVLTTSVSWEQWAQVVRESKLTDGANLFSGGSSAKASTLALAITAAALRARAAQ